MNTVAVSNPSRAPLGSLQGWRLFWLLALIASLIELAAWQTIDWRSGPDIRLLIGFNWRLSAPYFLLAFTASSLQRLFPSVFTRWLLANRRYFGLAFASVAGWQLVTIVILGMYFCVELKDIHSDSFQYVEDLIFVTLVLMTVTSFRPVSRHMRLTTWRRLHSTGIYLLGGLFTVNFLYFTLTATNVAYVMIISAFALAWGLRAAVWWQRRATFQGWKLFWALFGFANAAILGTWSYFGLQSDENLRYVTAVCTTLACLFFVAALLVPSLHRLWPTSAAVRLRAGQRHYLLAGLLSMAWYLVFMTVRAEKPMAAGAPPLPLNPGISIAIIVVALVILALTLVEKTPRVYLPDTGVAQRIAALALAALLTGGLLATRHEVVSAALAAACVAAWVVAVCAAFRRSAHATQTG